MCVQEVFLVMKLHPFGHDRSASGDNPRQASRRQLHMLAQQTRVDREIIHALFRLLDQRIPIDLPRKVLYLTIHLLQGLINRNRTHRNRAVTDNPLARLMDIIAGREIHQRVSAPFTTPYSLLDLLVDTGGKSGVADIGIDLYQELLTDNHRLGFRVIDIRRDDRATGGDFLADELRRDIRLQSQSLDLLVLTNRHVLHFRSDNALLRIIHLGDILTLFSPERQVSLGKTQGIQTRVRQSLTAISGSQFRQLNHIFTLTVPLLTYTRKSFNDINRYLGVGIRAARIVNDYRIVLLEDSLSMLIQGYRVQQFNLTHTNLDLIDLARDINLFRGRIGNTHILFSSHMYLV